MTSEAQYPDGLLYHPEHDWARIDGDSAVFGITWYGQDALGEIVFLELPVVGTPVWQGEPYTEIESVKAVSPVVAPLSGTIISVNEAISGRPEMINADPYGQGWIVNVRLTDASEQQRLLGAREYEWSVT